jgi:Domain of unknown function DUF1828
VKDQLCRAFCDGITVRDVPSGMAVNTAFSFPDGDAIGFYLSPEGHGQFKINDSGLVFPTLQASGLDLRNPQRAEAFAHLLGEYGVTLNDEDREFTIGGLDESQLPAAALRFVSFMLRVGDLLLLAQDRVASTFRHDVEALLREQLGDRALLSISAPLSPDLGDFLPDFTITSDGNKPVGVFLGTDDARVLEALYMQMRAEHEAHEPVSIVALLEREKAVTARVRQQATNRLTVAHFRGDEIGAIARIAKEAGLASVH